MLKILAYNVYGSTLICIRKKMKHEDFNPALLAVRAVGNQEKLAKKLTPPLSRQAVGAWVRNRKIPLHKVADVSRVTGIPKKILDPAFSD